MNTATLVAVLFFAAYTAADPADLTDHEIEAWFHLVDTDNDHKITDTELDVAHRVFGAKCSLTEQITAEEFFNRGDHPDNGGNGDGFLSEAELDNDFHLFGELVEGETQSYFEILDRNEDSMIDLEEMKAGVVMMGEQCAVLTDISAEKFKALNCFVDEIALADFSTCLRTMEADRRRRR